MARAIVADLVEVGPVVVRLLARAGFPDTRCYSQGDLFEFHRSFR